MRLFVMPLSAVADVDRGRVLTRDDIEILFSNWAQLTALHTRLLHSLEDECAFRGAGDSREQVRALCMARHSRLGADSPARHLPSDAAQIILDFLLRPDAHVAPIFLAYLHEAQEAYAQYVQAHDAALERLAALRGTDGGRYLREASAHPELGGLGVGALLACPISRLARYRLLFDEALRCTPAGHAEQAAMARLVLRWYGIMSQLSTTRCAASADAAAQLEPDAPQCWRQRSCPRTQWWLRWA